MRFRDAVRAGRIVRLKKSITRPIEDGVEIDTLQRATLNIGDLLGYPILQELSSQALRDARSFRTSVTDERVEGHAVQPSMLRGNAVYRERRNEALVRSARTVGDENYPSTRKGKCHLDREISIGAAGTTGCANPPSESVGALDRAENARGGKRDQRCADLRAGRENCCANWRYCCANSGRLPALLRPLPVRRDFLIE